MYFLVLEMFLWTTPFGQKTFKRTAEEQEATKVLAANQGLYNGFLAIGRERLHRHPTARVLPRLRRPRGPLRRDDRRARQILFVQALPAAIALAVTFGV